MTERKTGVSPVRGSARGWGRRASLVGALLLGLPLGLDAAGEPPAGGRAASPPPASFTLHNRSAYVIRAAYACSPRSATWGPNLLQGRALKPAGEARLALAGGCGTYDLRFVADDGIEFLEEEVPFCADDAAAAAAAAPVGPAPDREDLVTLGRDELVKVREVRPRPGPTGPAADSGSRQ